MATGSALEECTGQGASQYLHMRYSRIRYFFISGGQETGVEGWRMAAFVTELAFIFAIEGQKCESEKMQWKEKDGRDRQVV